MKTMIGGDRKVIEETIVELLASSVGFEYVERILAAGNLVEDIIQDVIETSAWEFEGSYNDDDVRRAIGRMLLSRLNPNS